MRNVAETEPGAGLRELLKALVGGSECSWSNMTLAIAPPAVATDQPPAHQKRQRDRLRSFDAS
jgi:hypothetical protein